MSQPSAKPDGAGPLIGILRCNVCTKSIDVRDSDGMHYIETNDWPVCCGETMLFVLTEQPNETSANSQNDDK
jgi:hypothetical protein